MIQVNENTLAKNNLFRKTPLRKKKGVLVRSIRNLDNIGTPPINGSLNNHCFLKF